MAKAKKEETTAVVQKENTVEELLKIDEPSKAIALYDITPAKITAILKPFDHLKVIEADTKSYKEVRAALTLLVSKRCRVDERRKHLGIKLRDSLSNINQAGKMLIEPMAPYEERFSSELKAEDDRKDKIKQEKIRIEEERKQGIRAKVTDLGAPSNLQSFALADLRTMSTQLEEMDIKEAEYMEYTEEATKVLDDTYNTVQDAIATRIKLDKEDADRKAEDARLEKIRLDLERVRVKKEEIDKAFEDQKTWFIRNIKGDSFQTPNIEEIEKAIPALETITDHDLHEPALTLLLDEQVEEAHGILRFRKDQAKVVEAQKKIDDEKAKIAADKKADEERKEKEAFEKEATEKAEAAATQKLKDAASAEEERAKTAAAEKARQEMLAPDKEKLLAFADKLMDFAHSGPTLKSKTAQDLIDQVAVDILGTVATLRERAEEL